MERGRQQRSSSTLGANRSPIGSPRRSAGSDFRRSGSPPRKSMNGAREPDAMNPGNNLYVTGLSTRVTERELEEHFMREGKVQQCRLVVDPRTRESRGFGFVTMETVDDAERCIKYLNRSTLEGRIITVEKAKRKRARTPTPGEYLGVRAIGDFGRGRRDGFHQRRSPRYSPYGGGRGRSPRYSPRYSPYRGRDRSPRYSPYRGTMRYGRSRSPQYSPQHSRSPRRFSPPPRSRSPLRFRSRSPLRLGSPRPYGGGLNHRSRSRSLSPGGFRGRH
ncbi:hypothetical protein CBR_g61511 [Chara braunii]|uniref:RRM domain-containing protein n=1 Tax=Chara braunii TaxID=69332 RepID=A0A388K8T5_CHABU|nr:hypothetical protein CBR_g61511 [Chara braunii]|eukprot:GBG66468.1 hypothetical protein CBR_g61511 [Chara braunii]